MCLLTLAWQAHEKYKLVVVANRDEYYSRPAKPAHFWTDYPNILAGRDLQSNGTWLGVSTGGRFAVITNYRDPPNYNAEAKSRGKLVSEFLHTGISISQYSQFIKKQGHLYNGFNLLLSDGRSLMYCSNRIDKPLTLKPGIYALSNAFLDTPWPKTKNAREKLENWLKQPGQIDDLSGLLFDTRVADDEHLPNTGIPYAMEKALSSQLIQLDEYGTRCATAFMVDHNGNADFYERNLEPQKEIISHHLDSFWQY